MRVRGTSRVGVLRESDEFIYKLGLRVFTYPFSSFPYNHDPGQTIEV